MYRTLDPAHIVKTLETLEGRINRRFPKSGLSKVCAELIDVAKGSGARIATLTRPNLLLRAGIISVLALGIILLAYLATLVHVKNGEENVFDIMQGIDSAFNVIVLMGAGALFLVSLEDRWKRQQVMEHLHELRSIVHVIDMHQLPKDPSSDHPPTVATPEGPQREMSPFELSRYLDYCSEMLSLAAKVAALYAQSTKDPIIIDATSDLSQMTSDLSNKIWQKITMIQLPAIPPMPTPKTTVST